MHASDRRHPTVPVRLHSWQATRACNTPCHPDRSEERAEWRDLSPHEGVLRLYARESVSATLRRYDSNLEQRVAQHKAKAIPGFTSRYNIDRLVWFESIGNAFDAVERERLLKNWCREKKEMLIEMDNAAWEDLAAEW